MNRNILQVMAYGGMVAEEFKTKIQMNLNFEVGILRFVWVKDDKVVNLELSTNEITQSRDLEEYRNLMIRKVWSGMEC